MGKYKIVLLIFILMILPDIRVNASTRQFNMCFGNDGLYSITYDDAKNSAVSKDKIDISAAKVGHLPYPNGVEDTAYKFNAIRIGSKCYISGDSIKSCPSDSGAFDKIMKAYIVHGTNNVSVSNKIDMNFNLGTGKFDIVIRDQFNNQYDVRYVKNDSEFNDYNSASYYNGQFLPRSGNGMYYINNVEPSSTVGLEFYLKSGDNCNGTFVGRIVFFTPSPDEVEIDNPAINGGYGCDQVKAYVPNGIKSSDMSALNALKKNMVNLCYQNKITYTDYTNMSARVSSGLESLKQLFAGYNVTTAGGGNSCSDTYHGATALGYSESGHYWAISCTENYSSSGTNPKLVSAGAGFNYEADFTITKTCKLVQHTFPVMKPKCHSYCSCSCSWSGSSGGESGVDSAGPNDTFDKCVNQCDGGKYTQACVNSCYDSSYKKGRDTSAFNNFSIDSKKNKTEFTAFTGTVTAEEAYSMGLVNRIPGYTSHGLPGFVYTRHGDGHADCSCSVSNWCAGGHGSCSYHFWVGPSGCVDDPVSLYNQELAYAASERAEFEAIAKADINIGDYKMTITDSYINDGKYKLVLSSNTDPALNISSNQTVSGMGKIAHVHLSLPLSYVNKITGDATYRSNPSSQPYALNSKVGRLEAVNNFNENNFYFTRGEKKYYTSINSRNTNVAFKNGKAVLTPNTYNIEVKAENVGWSRFSSTNKCYYGVYNGFYNFRDDNNGNNSNLNNCNPLTEICDGGIQYIFRPIVLGDAFPNGRNPRYNWSTAATGKGNTLYGSQVDPVGYTKKIQSKQQQIYEPINGEIDYEFILTPKSIKEIKAYNKQVEDFNKDGAKNYLDYDLSCYTRKGREICTSKFLDRTDILQYGSGYSADQRKSIAGCNNARDNGSQCDTSAHQ